MTATVVDIYNWALAALGNRSRIQSPEEDSREALRCGLFYENVRDQILRSAPWNAAKAYKRLALSAERDDDAAWVATDPAPGWRYSYSTPPDFLWPRSISTFARFEQGLSSTNTRVIFTNDEAPILVYTKRQERVDLWEADLQAAVAFALAAHICQAITGSNDKVRLVTAQAIDKILAARQNDANASDFQLDWTPEHIAARGAALAAPVRPFIYPPAEFSYAGFSSALT